MTRARLGLATGLALLAGCSSAPPAPPAPPPPAVAEAPEPPPPGWTVGAWPAHLPRAEYAAAVATSTDAAFARREALAALEVRLFGPVERRPFEAVPDALRPIADPELGRSHEQDGLHHVLVAASRAASVARLDAWAAALSPDAPLPEETKAGERVLVSGEQVEAPRAHLDALIAHTRFRRAKHFACVQAPVRTSTCAAPNPKLLEDALTSFLDAIALTPEPPDGVPVHPRAGALRPATVKVTWTSPGLPPRPLEDVPVTLSLWGETRTEASDADGMVRAPVPPERAPGAPGAAIVDRSALLGGLSDLWPAPPSTKLSLRSLDLEHSRLALDITERASGRPSTDGTESLRRALLAGGLGAVFYLDEARALATPIEATAVTALADAARGQIDLVAVGTFDSHFASQMGARSVWYEATGEIELYDAWSGTRIATFEDAARAVAIGEAAAARAAVETLGKKLADRMQAALRDYHPPAMARADVR